MSDTLEDVTIKAVNVERELSAVPAPFTPKTLGIMYNITGAVNVVAAKFLGEYGWHHHPNGPELFYVVRGAFDLHTKQTNNLEHCVRVQAGECVIVPAGLEHNTIAEKEAEILMIEPENLTTIRNMS